MARKVEKPVLTTKSKDWKKFCLLLEGKEGIKAHKDAKTKKLIWHCDHTLRNAKKILKKYFPEYSVPKTTAYFEEHGGYCDCEVLWNVDLG